LRPTRAMHNPNFAYFVYDGVPEWKGAIDPECARSKTSPGCDVSSAALQRVPVYQLISSQPAVEGATWLDPE